MQSRRQFLILAGVGSTAALAVGRAAAQAATQSGACYNPDAETMNHKNARSGLGYKDVSPEPSKHCSLCAFFNASSPKCGTCQLMEGAAVNIGGVCTSFAAKS